MKTIALTLPVLFSSILLSSELSWVDDQVDSIKPPRVGMKYSALNSIKSPFIFLEKNKTEKKEVVKKTATGTKQNPLSPISAKAKQVKTASKLLVLSAIMNNSAMINGKWYKTGDTLNGYAINEINPNTVLLHKNKKQLLLSTKSNTKKLKFLNK